MARPTKFDTLPSNRNDRENERFGLDTEGYVGVRTLGATTTSSGEALEDVLGEYLNQSLILLKSIDNNMVKILNHIRAINQMECESDTDAGY